jgi:2'-5' RNA ligase
VRIFIGIEIDAEGRKRADAIIRDARHLLDAELAIRWIPPENLHLTLWFIGEVAEPRAAAIQSAIAQPFDLPPFDLRLKGLGAFPKSGAPRVLWIGVEQGADALRAIHAQLAVRLRPLGIEPERRPFAAHMTLGRVKGAREGVRKSEVRALLHQMPGDAGTCRIACVTLFRSRLSPKGAVYEPLVRVPLQ